MSNQERNTNSGAPFGTPRFELDLDLRLGLDLWDALGEPVEATLTNADLLKIFASAMRVAHFRGYLEATCEPNRGQLLRDHGLPVPPRRKQAPPPPDNGR
jgi:hypothetical protein